MFLPYRLRRHPKHTNRPSSCPNLPQRRRKNWRHDYVGVSRHRPAIHRMLCNARRHPDGLRICARRGPSILLVCFPLNTQQANKRTNSSSTLSKINSYTHTPVNAVWFVVFFAIALNCIAIGSTQTATAIFSITAPALDISYVSVILAHQIYKHQVSFVEGPFTLGRWGSWINWISISWVLFISTVLFFPPHVPVTAENMYVIFSVFPLFNFWCLQGVVLLIQWRRNYAVFVGLFIAIFALVWWWIDARGYV